MSRRCATPAWKIELITRLARRTLPTIAVLAITAVPEAWGAWPHDTETNLLLSTGPLAKLEPAVVSDASGGMIVAWLRGTSGPAAQRFDASGVPQWAGSGVSLCSCVAMNSPFTEAVRSVPDGLGGAIIAWTRWDPIAGTAFPSVQRVSAAGVAMWGANGVSLATYPASVLVAQQYVPSVTSDGAGGAIVTWSHRTTLNIHAQHVDAAGAITWAAGGVVVCGAAGDQDGPQVVSDGAGGAIIAWRDLRGGTAEVFARRVNAAGVPQWTADGVLLCLAGVGARSGAVLIRDESNGAIVAWVDSRSDAGDIYATRVSGSGTLLWDVDGVPLCVSVGVQSTPVMGSDGAGGAIVAWADSRTDAGDIYVRRVSVSGGPQWTADGVPLCSAAGLQTNPRIASDAVGGAIVAWQDSRGTTTDIFARRIGSNGVAQWSTNGVALTTAGNDQREAAIVGHGQSGAVVVWEDQRGSTLEIYGQNVERFGQLGNPVPDIVGVRDVPNDQGGRVVVEWTSSYLDADPAFGIDSYSLWRRVPSAAALAARSRGALTRTTGAAVRTTTESGQTVYWEFVSSQPARGFPGYSIAAPTTSDSIAGSNPLTSFMVEANAGGGIPYWDSAPDSGYSVDNLPPATPQMMTGAYSAGATAIHWAPSPEGDFAEYRLYRGTTSDFVPGSGNLVVAKPDTGHTDTGPAGWYYKLSAVDVHGNESGFALLTPQGTSDVPGSEVRGLLALAHVTPNPFGGRGPLRFTLPRAGHVSLSIIDVEGRLVRSLLHGHAGVGEHVVVWDGLTSSGAPCPSGLYYLKLSAEGRVLSRRFTLLR